MPKPKFILVCTLILSVSFCVLSAEAKSTRSQRAKFEFRKEHSCPANGRTKGKCPGYVVDHITPLCAGGADLPFNMQWQSRTDASAKDIEERRQCAASRGGKL